MSEPAVHTRAADGAAAGVFEQLLFSVLPSGPAGLPQDRTPAGLSQDLGDLPAVSSMPLAVKQP